MIRLLAALIRLKVARWRLERRNARREPNGIRPPGPKDSRPASRRERDQVPLTLP